MREVAGGAALLLFTKPPVPGRSKTRLAARLGSAGACRVAAALLRDLEDNLGGWRGERFLACEEEEAEHPELARLVRHGWRHLPASSASLGELLSTSFRWAFDQGFSPVVAIGGDLPDLGCDDLDEALRSAAVCDAVLGPTLDGGYYLIAMRAFLPEAFAGIPWSTADTLEATLARLSTAGRSVRLLPPRRDVDTWEDLAALLADSGRRTRCRRTVRAARPWEGDS